jgi:hypothetical protein
VMRSYPGDFVVVDDLLNLISFEAFDLWFELVGGF